MFPPHWNPLTSLATLILAATLGLSAAPVKKTAPAQKKEQAPTGPNGLRLTKYIIGVADLDKSYAFYRALGIELEVPAKGKAAIKKPAVLPDMLRKLVDVSAKTKFRNAMLKIPGADFPLEITEFSGMELKPGRPRPQDPGAAILILTVRDINAAFAIARQAGAEVVTAGGAPVSLGPGGTRAVMVRDPDSFYIEFVQANPAPAYSDGQNIVAARFANVVPDAEKAAQFYRDRFGMESKVSPWNSDKAALGLAGVASGQMRSSSVAVPGARLSWSLIEFKTAGMSPYKLRIPDPGAPAIGFEVRNLAEAFSAIKATGGSIITVDEKPIQAGKDNRVAFTRDPNGILVELAQTSAKSAKPAK